MPCFECEEAQVKGYAYWCSICTTFIPSQFTSYDDTEEDSKHYHEEVVCTKFQCDCKDLKDRAGIILLNQKGELLLVRGPTGKLSLPKGKRKVCETDYEGACRECFEESGIDVRGMPIKRRETIQDVVYFYVSFTGPEDANLGSVNSSEISQVKWWKVISDSVKKIPYTIIHEEVLDSELLQEYTSKHCNISLDTLLRKKKFYQGILRDLNR